MRYFLFAYTATYRNGSGFIHGNLSLIKAVMPSNKLLCEVVIPADWASRMIELDRNSVVINNIIEFKNEEDYTNFNNRAEISAEELKGLKFQ